MDKESGLVNYSDHDTSVETSSTSKDTIDAQFECKVQIVMKHEEKVKDVDTECEQKVCEDNLSVHESQLQSDKDCTTSKIITKNDVDSLKTFHSKLRASEEEGSLSDGDIDRYMGFNWKECVKFLDDTNIKYSDKHPTVYSSNLCVTSLSPSTASNDMQELDANTISACPSELTSKKDIEQNTEISNFEAEDGKKENEGKEKEWYKSFAENLEDISDVENRIECDGDTGSKPNEGNPKASVHLRIEDINSTVDSDVHTASGVKDISNNIVGYNDSQSSQDISSEIVNLNKTVETSEVANGNDIVKPGLENNNVTDKTDDAITSFKNCEDHYGYGSIPDYMETAHDEIDDSQGNWT